MIGSGKFLDGSLFLPIASGDWKTREFDFFRILGTGRADTKEGKC
jgi:hypothetical protein